MSFEEENAADDENIRTRTDFGEVDYLLKKVVYVFVSSRTINFLIKFYINICFLNTYLIECYENKHYLK